MSWRRGTGRLACRFPITAMVPCAEGEEMRALELATNPALVDRMLPHPRCVAITRIRRKHREFSAPEDMAQAFMNIEKMMQDEAIQILIRDGENLHMMNYTPPVSCEIGRSM